MSSHDPRARSSRCCNAASCARISLWPSDSPFRPCVSESSLSGVFGLNFLSNVRRHLFVMVELHGEGGAPLSLRAQRIDVTKHVGKRHHRANDVGVAAHVLALDLTSPRIEIADHRAGIFF